jgi:hypothetical protein
LLIINTIHPSPPRLNGIAVRHGAGEREINQEDEAMADTIFTKHDRVTIYQDPITEEKEEGKAELISLDHTFHGIETWTVRFIGEQRHFQRRILTTGKNAPVHA